MDDMSVSGRDRQVLFQNLKPCCVKISQLAIRDLQLRTPLQELVGLTGHLLVTLEDQVGRDPALLEEKLAEYVFFPLYHIFCQMKRFPESVVENSIKCLRILIIYGWKSKISAKMVQKILSLVIFIIDGPPGSHHRRKPPEETVLEAFRTQTALLNTAALSATAASGLSAQEVVPVLGHGITVMLDGAVDGASPPIQLEALYSLRAVYGALKEHEALASFLPGTISLLTKILSMPNRYKTKVLAESVHTVQIALTHVLGDVRTRAIFTRNQSEEPTDHGKPKTLSPAWLQGTVAQVKVALAKIMKLRTQEKPLLRKALGRLCIALIDECHITLESGAEMLVETAMILDSDLDTADMTQPNLSHLVNIYPKLGETVKTIVYNWLSRLSRVMQMGDDDTRKVAIHDLGNGIDLCRRLSLESTSLDDILSVTLKDSMVALILSSPKQLDYEGKIQLYDGTMSLDLSTLDDQFQPIILSSQSQKDLKMEWTHLLDRLGSKSQKAQLAASLMEFVRESSSVDRTAAMWLCFQLVKRSGDFDGDADGFLDLSIFGEAPEDADAVLNGLYNFAVQAINCHTELASEDWACQALSLEVIAFAAEKAGRSFRPELIDVLFPIATFFGSENVRLRQHAIVTLNRIASSVQYPSVSDLVIDNADYMINSVALRLNTLDISPASMQVLLMMTRLTGSRLVPFLDDVVDSIIAALDSFHGHTSFTESLFTTLKEIADQISGVDQRLLCHHELAAVDHRKQRQNKDEMKHLLDYLDRRAERLARDAEEAASQRLIESHPKDPWKSETATEANGADLVDQQRTSHHDEKPPSSPTYQLLLRIVYLAEHYLTSPSPKLRRSLLELLATASRTLAGNEDSFLPAVNAIWPVVISRLRDPETFIIVEACHTLSSLCETAGDFLSSRFQTEWTNGLHEWCCKVKQQNSNESVFRATKKGNPGAHGTGNIVIPIQLADGIGRQEAAITARTVSGSGSLEQHSSAAKVWEAVVQLLTSILSFVNVTEAMFDEILDILSDVMEVNKDVREALETIDADAVWLIRYARGYIDPLPAPQMEGSAFVPMEKMPRCCE